MVTGRFFDGTDDLSDAFAIRRTVFVEEQNIPEEQEFDSYEEQAVHVVAYDAQKPVATARLLVTDGKYMLGHVAVLPQERGKQYGDFVVRMLADKAFLCGIDVVYVAARTEAAGFYESIGFQSCSDEFEENGILRLMMKMPESSFRRCRGCQD